MSPFVVAWAYMTGRRTESGQTTDNEREGTHPTGSDATIDGKASETA